VTHAEVRERLADALLSPGTGGLDAALGDPGTDAVAMREHLAGCPSCTAELAALRATGALLAAAAPDSLTAPLAVRVRTLAAVRAARPRPLPVRSWRPTRTVAFAALAAAVIVVAGLAGGIGLIGQRDAADRRVAELQTLATASRDVLADPAAIRLALAGPGGDGSVVLSPGSGRLVVVARGLPALPEGGHYGCYIERGGQRTWIGSMSASADLAWWVGWISEVASPGQAGDRFLVTAGPDDRPLLSGQF
jgi:hypothetical protein